MFENKSCCSNYLKKKCWHSSLIKDLRKWLLLPPIGKWYNLDVTKLHFGRFTADHCGCCSWSAKQICPLDKNGYLCNINHIIQWMTCVLFWLWIRKQVKGGWQLWGHFLLQNCVFACCQWPMAKRSSLFWMRPVWGLLQSWGLWVIHTQHLQLPCDRCKQIAICTFLIFYHFALAIREKCWCALLKFIQWVY